MEGDFMKKIISIALILALCCACFSGCSYFTYRNESKAEVVKSSFCAVMESYNGYMTITNQRMELKPTTTVREVVDFLKAEGITVTLEYIDTSMLFLDGCVQVNGYYQLRADVDWLEYYTEEA